MYNPFPFSLSPSLSFSLYSHVSLIVFCPLFLFMLFCSVFAKMLRCCYQLWRNYQRRSAHSIDFIGGLLVKKSRGED